MKGILCVLIFLAGMPLHGSAGLLSTEEIDLLQKHSLPPGEPNLANRAFELSLKLGREVSVEGLDAILTGGNALRLRAYLQGFGHRGNESLPVAIEALIVRHYRNIEFQDLFIDLFAGGRAKFQSVPLFDLLHQSLVNVLNEPNAASRQARVQRLTRAVLASDRHDVEARIFELLPRLKDVPFPTFEGSSHDLAMEFLARRKYARLVPYLSALLDVRDASREPERFGVLACLDRLDTVDSSEAVRKAAVLLDRLLREPYARGSERTILNIFALLQRHNFAFDPAALMAVLKDRGPRDQVARTIVSILIANPEPSAIRAMVERMERIVRSDPSGASESGGHVEFMLRKLEDLKDHMALDYAQLRQALPGRLSDSAIASHLKLIKARRELLAVPDLLGYLADSKVHGQALDLLLEYDSADVWRQARAEIERLKQQGKLDDARYHSSAMRLDGPISEPTKYSAVLQQRMRGRDYEVRRGRASTVKYNLRKLLDSQPEQYVARYVENLKTQENLVREYPELPQVKGLRGEIGSDYFVLGNLVRFRLKQPAQAIPLYAKAQEFEVLFGEIASGDTYQFDLNDWRKALAEFERLLQRMQGQPLSTNDMEADLGHWFRQWLTQQVHFLKTGKVFTGAITREDIGGFGALLYFGGGSAQEEFPQLASPTRSISEAMRGTPGAAAVAREEVARKIEALPASYFTLTRTTKLATMLPDDGAILRYLDKHDPAGYLSACLLAMVGYVDGQPGGDRQSAGVLPGLAMEPSGSGNPLRMAAARYFKERKITADTRPDPRMSTPENTWKLLIASLVRGDLETAMSCLTPGLQGRFRPGWSQMSADALRNTGESFTGFSMSADMGEMKEAVAVRGNRAGMIYFVNVGGAWKINEM